MSDQGRYICRATNVDGEAEAVAEVFVNGKHYFYFNNALLSSDHTTLLILIAVFYKYF